MEEEKPFQPKKKPYQKLKAQKNRGGKSFKDTAALDVQTVM